MDPIEIARALTEDSPCRRLELPDLRIEGSLAIDRPRRLTHSRRRYPHVSVRTEMVFHRLSGLIQYTDDIVFEMHVERRQVERQFFRTTGSHEQRSDTRLLPNPREGNSRHRLAETVRHVANTFNRLERFDLAPLLAVLGQRTVVREQTRP